MISIKRFLKNMLMPGFCGYTRIYVGYEDILSSDTAFHNLNPFSAWNAPSLLPLRNCYAFAADALDPLPSTFKDQRLGVFYNIPTVGISSGYQINTFKKAYMDTALECDGFIPIATDDQNKIVVPKEHHLIAAFIAVGLCGSDYHFYRYHETSNCWYHKLGYEGIVSCLDEEGKIIINPRDCARGHYEYFVGFYLSPKDRKQINIVVENPLGKILYGRLPENPLFKRHHNSKRTGPLLR